MNLSSFFEHWGIVENPFRGEEARHDPVFLRLRAGKGQNAPQGAVHVITDGAHAPAAGRSTHSDFEKIAGDFDRPSTAIVFGEKGSGKTAIRIQLAERIAAHNTANPASRTLLVAYDDLNPFLDRFCARSAEDRRKASLLETFRRIRLVDHIDALLGMVVPKVADGVLGEHSNSDPIDLGPEPRKTARKLDPSLRRDLLLLQAVYDGAESAADRTSRLRRLLRLPLPRSYAVWSSLAYGGWLLPLGAAAAAYIELGWTWNLLAQVTVGALLVLWLAVLFKKLAIDRFSLLRLARRLRRQLRSSNRSERSYARSLAQLDSPNRDPALLPLSDSDEQRYAMLDRLRRVLGPFGYSSAVVIIDRVDEPTLISGDPERMQAVIWPLMNNKFLAQNGVGVKMLLPMELRHALFRESAAFFQEARLDKQNLIERLNWTGSMLFDLCNARLQACLATGAQPIALLDLFTEDVTRQDLVDALDQMHQPRDAFKMLYQCLTEHCSNVTEDQAQWRIPRLVLESVRKEQSERVRQLYRGVRPA